MQIKNSVALPRLVALHVCGYALGAPFVGGFLATYADYSTAMRMPPWQALITSCAAGIIAVLIYGPAGFLFGIVTAIPIRLPIIYWVGNLLGCFLFMYLASKGSFFESYATYLSVSSVVFATALTYLIQKLRTEQANIGSRSLERRSD